MDTLESLSVKGFFSCEKDKLYDSPYCLFCYIYILMNKREIYFLCDNSEEYICLEYLNDKCKHCKRLEKYNSLFEKIRNKKTLILNERRNYSLKLFDLVDRCAEFVLKYKKYILHELKNKICDLDH